MSKNLIDIPKGFSPLEPVGDPAAQPNHQKSEQASIEAPTDTNAETSEPPAESSDFPPIPLLRSDACVKSVQQFGMQNRFAVASANQYLVQGQQQFVYHAKYRPHQKPKKAQDVDEEEEETNKTDEPNNAEGTAPTPGLNAGKTRLARQHPTCILIDATYKTNLFKMPLLHIAGINSSNKTFTFAFAFISREKEETSRGLWISFDWRCHCTSLR
ncbi:hypothetical protein PSHT_11284 [Puccinia striiformis]|uniref:MULE transposase domain-containing protein n=1 Tax=Puccinia striiformis TaxID=27350 RepID=A0A2S4V4F6_9BASI|nr:hypothetical protein PSHT_11284 [Puccinia striiformis]